MKAHTDFGDIEVTEAEDATLDLDTNSGAITFAGSLGDGVCHRIPRADLATFMLEQIDSPTYLRASPVVGS